MGFRVVTLFAPCFGVVMVWSGLACAQGLESLGLAGHDLTSLGVYGGIVAAGSNGQGVSWQYEDQLPGDWVLAGLEGAEILAVYPHKSGPLGWALGAGVRPAEGDSTFVYCAYMGQGFEPLSDGITPSLTGAVTELDGFPDPTICGETYAAGGRAVYRRQFGSDVWETVYTATIEGDVHTVRTHDSAPGVVLAGGGEGFAGGYFLLKSLDFGDTWQWESPPGYTFDVDFTGDAGDTIFTAAAYTVQRSLDGGATWQPVYTIDPPYEETITEVAIQPRRGRVYIAGTSTSGEAPLLGSPDWGATWRRIHTGAPGEIVDLDVDAEENLLIAHHTAGVLRLSGDLTDTPEVTPIGTLRQNQPNPFNPTTRIPFSLTTHADVVLKVWNAEGKLVRTLLDADLPAGLHSATWDGRDESGNDVASGVYLYQLDTGDARQARRMVLLR